MTKKDVTFWDENWNKVNATIIKSEKLDRNAGFWFVGLRKIYLGEGEWNRFHQIKEEVRKNQFFNRLPKVEITANVLQK
jgi:hypothetical protein